MPVVGELAIGVASSIIFEGLKRPFATIQAELLKRKNIGRALSDRLLQIPTAQDRRTEAVIGDLARVIGNKEGKLTFGVAEFLNELQRTALPEAIAHAALCGSDSSPLKPAFHAFASSFQDLPFTPQQLMDALYEASRLRVEAVNDPALLEIIRAQHGELSTNLQQIAQALENLSKHDDPLQISEIKEARLKVARAIEAANRTVNVETLRGSRKFNLKKLVIPGRLTPLDASHIQSAKAPIDGTTISYIGFRRSLDRAVILGDPGGGKSTLTQLMCFDLSKLIGLEAINQDHRYFDNFDLKLPIRIILRSYEAKQSRVPSYNFLDYICDDLKVALDNDHDLARRFIGHILTTGEGVLIFDGLDEVLDVGARRTMATKIEQFSEIYAACPILVTSRLVGYRDAPLRDDFKPFGLARFNLEEVRTYSEKAIRAVETVSVNTAKSRAAEFIKQTSRVGSDLRENPLMLGLMVQIFVNRGDVPSNRPEIYKECASLMFEKWDERRDIMADVPREELVILDVFGYVANLVFGDADREEGVSKDWLSLQLRNHFNEWFVDKASANRAAVSLVAYLTGRAWVMSEVGHETFKFTHRTFLEYFFARFLISESRGVDELLQKRIMPRVSNNEWVLISHLALHMSIFKDGGRSKQAAEAIISSLRDVPLPAAQELPVIEFVAAALDYLIIPEPLYVTIVDIILDRVVLVGSHENLQAIAVLGTLVQTSGRRIELVKTRLIEHFMRWINGSSKAEQIFCVYALGARRPEAGLFHISRQRQFIPGTTWQLLDPVRRENKEKLFDKAMFDIDVARAYVFAYDDRRDILYGAHGPRLIETLPSPLVPPGANQILTSALEIVTASLRQIGSDGRFSKGTVEEECRALVDMVAVDLLSGRLSLSAPLPNPEHEQIFEEDIESSLHYLYSSFSRGRRPAKSKATLACQVLVCLCSLVVKFPVRSRRRSRVTNVSRTYDLVAPLSIWKALVSALSTPDYALFLDEWIQRVSERAYVGDSPRPEGIHLIEINS